MLLSVVRALVLACAIVAVKATCTSGSCIPAAGEMKVEITLGDGSVVETSTGWSGG